MKLREPGKRARSVIIVAGSFFVLGLALYTGWPEGGISAQSGRDVCQQKKATLARLESAAPTIRTLIGKAQAIFAELEKPVYANDSRRIRDFLIGREQDVDAILEYDVDAVLLDLPNANPRELVELFDDRPQANRSTSGGTVLEQHGTYQELKKQYALLKKRQDYVANQIFLIRDSIKQLGCDVTATPVRQGAKVDPAKLNIFKDEQRFQLELKDRSITLSNGREEKKLFWLTILPVETGMPVRATLTTLVPLNAMIPNYFAAAGREWSCDGAFDGENLALACGDSSERDIFAVRVEVAIVGCVLPKLNGTVHYKGGYEKPAQQWNVKGQLLIEGPTPADCDQRKSVGGGVTGGDGGMLNRAQPVTIWGPINQQAGLDGKVLALYEGTTVEQCQADCAKNASCNGFTLIRPGTFSPNAPPMCYQISEATRFTPRSCCISGMKQPK